MSAMIIQKMKSYQYDVHLQNSAIDPDSDEINVDDVTVTHYTEAYMLL